MSGSTQLPDTTTAFPHSLGRLHSKPRRRNQPAIVINAGNSRAIRSKVGSQGKFLAIRNPALFDRILRFELTLAPFLSPLENWRKINEIWPHFPRHCMVETVSGV